jgi:dihydrolipoamide dehydrogenase
MISEIALAIEKKISLKDLANLIHPHPTLSEVVMGACEDALGFRRI